MKEKYDIILVGHISKDIIIVKNRRTETLGGAVFYSSIAAKRSGVDVLVVTKLSEKDFSLLAYFEKEGIDTVPIPSRHTTSIENIYYTEDMDRRKVRLISRAEPFTLDDIPNVRANVIHLAGLFRGEIPDTLIEPLSERGAIALDVQGILRCSEEGKLLFKDWEKKEKLLPKITYLKTDTAEAEIITGITDREQAAKLLYEMGAREVMVTHSSEVILFDGKRIYRAPFTSENLSGRTGRGDTCFASYLAYRISHGIAEALNYAAALTSTKMETPGPFQGTESAVLERIEREKKNGDG